MLRKSILILFVTMVVLIIVACGSPSSPEPTPTPTEHPGKAVVSSRCIGCHELNRVTNAAYDEKGWQLTVDRMVLNGAQLTDEQVEMAVDYLSYAYPKE